MRAFVAVGLVVLAPFIGKNTTHGKGLSDLTTLNNPSSCKLALFLALRVQAAFSKTERAQSCPDLLSPSREGGQENLFL